MPVREHIALAVLGAVAVPLLLALHACHGDAAGRAQLASDNPLDRAEAIVRVSEAGDLKAVQKLVELLDDPNPAVRMYVILALQSLCGQDFGYRYYENDAARMVAVQRWHDALRAGLIVPHSAPQTAPAPEARSSEPSEGATDSATNQARVRETASP